MNIKIKLTFLALLLFLTQYAFALTIGLTPSSFPCGTTTVSATTGCSFMGTIEVIVNGSPSGVIISNVSMVTGGTFTFQIAVNASAPPVGQLNFRILTSNDPTGCALPNAQDEVTVDFLCACNLVVTATSADESCFLCQDGTASILVDGATEPVSYLWSNGATTAVLENLAPGNYSVVITDANNCVENSFVTILPYICTPFQVIANVTSATCHNDCNGSISITGLSNGSQPVLYTWNTGATSGTLVDLCAATYAVTVTNDKNCSGISSFVVGQPSAIILTIDTIINYSAAAPGKVTVSMSGVTSGYTCVCNPITGTCGDCVETSITSASMEGLSLGCYQMTVINLNGCTATTDTFCIEQMTSTVNYLNLNSVQIYPNPTSDLIRVQYADGSHPAEMILRNILGTTVGTYKNTNSIEVSHLQIGVYFLTIYDENYTLTRTITKQD